MIATARPQLRGYQTGFVQRLRQAFHVHQRVLGVMPTGGGKTVVAGWLVDSAVAAKGKRVLFLAHRKELIEQCSRKLDHFGVAHAVIMAGHPRSDLAQPVQVASVQTLVRRLKALTGADPGIWGGTVPSWQTHYDLIIVDEAHHAAASTYVQIFEAWPQAKVLGLTATPYRQDGQGLGDLFEHLEVGCGVADLIREGWLVKTRTFAPPPPPELASVHVQAGDFRADEADQVLNQTAPLQEIVDTWHRRAAGRITVAFACSVRHAQRIATAFQSCGIAAAAIDGNTSAEERDRRLAELAAGKLQVLANCALLTEGWDLPACSSVILARPTQSRALWRQMIGRGVRCAEGKTDCVVLDHAGNCHRFGSPDESEHYSLQHELEVDGPGDQLVCRECHAWNPPELTRCEECGAFLPRPRNRSGEGRDRDGRGDSSSPAERKAIDLEDFKPMSESDRLKWYHARLNEAEARGFKPGWAAHRYRERFGHYPPTQWRFLQRQHEVHA